MIVKANDVNSIVVESGTYQPMAPITLVESGSDKIKYYVRNIVLSNTGAGKVTVSIRLRNNIVISQTLEPDEYFNYTPQLIVNNINPLVVIADKNTLDISVLFIEKIELQDS